MSCMVFYEMLPKTPLYSLDMTSWATLEDVINHTVLTSLKWFIYFQKPDKQLPTKLYPESDQVSSLKAIAPKS